MTTQTVGGRIYEFGLRDRLRIAREEAGFDQRSFEGATGISRASISNYERGITKPRRPQLAAWSLATGFSVEWLTTGEVATGRDPNGEGIHVTSPYRALPPGTEHGRTNPTRVTAPNRSGRLQELAA